MKMNKNIKQIIEACMKKSPGDIKAGVDEALKKKLYEKLAEKKIEISNEILRR